MVKSGKLPSLPSNISAELGQVIRAMLTLNVSSDQVLPLFELTCLSAGEAADDQGFAGIGADEDSPEALYSPKSVSYRCWDGVNKAHEVGRAALIVSRKEELKLYEDSLRCRTAALDEKEKALAAEAASLKGRADELERREEECRETQRRLNTAAEHLREQWEKMREEKNRDRDSLGSDTGVIDVPETARMSRRPSLGPARPLLEARNTVPILPAASRATTRTMTSTHAAYEDTPSKIPLFASASPTNIGGNNTGRSITPIRRNNTKSLGNIGAAYRAQSLAFEGTPARQAIPRYGFKQRVSIGSPAEMRLSEDISMASPASSAFPSPAPFPTGSVARTRRSSVAPSIAAAHPTSRTMSTATSYDSISSTDSGSSSEGLYVGPLASASGPAYTYRETATPAKWGNEDPDLPSPFIRRAPTAPAQSQHTSQSHSSSQSSTSWPTRDTISQPGSVSGRQPLGAIDPQPTASQLAGAGPGPGGKKAPVRSRSGTLHQQVLKSNAVRSSEVGRNRISVAR